MPDTPATRAVVTSAYNWWQKRLTQFNNGEPGVTRADVARAKKILADAVADWESPGPSEQAKEAKADRKPKRKSWWPKWK